MNLAYLVRLSRTGFLIPHFILFSLFAFPFAGAVDKIVLPEGMQTVDFSGCSGLTGTAELRMSDVHIYLIRFGGQPKYILRSSFSFLLLLFSYLFALCFFSQATLRSGIFPWACRN